MWGWDRIGVVKTSWSEQEGWTFNDYLDAGGKGVSIVATPVEGLTLGVGIPLVIDQTANWDAPTYKNTDGISKDGPKTLSGIYAHGAAYVGAYAIEGIGTIKAAVKTEPKSGDKSHTKLGFAFDLSAVENLFVTVGAKIDTLEKTYKEINAYARYNMDALAIHAIVGTVIGGQYKNKDGEDKDGGFGFLAGAGVDYNLDGGIGIFADIRYANNVYYSQSQADNCDCFTLGAGVTKGFSNGLIGVAFEGATNSKSRYQQKDGKQFGWEIPVKFEYWF